MQQCCLSVFYNVLVFMLAFLELVSHPLLSAYYMGSIMLNSTYTISFNPPMYYGKYCNFNFANKEILFALSFPAKWWSQHLNPDQSDSRQPALSISSWLYLCIFKRKCLLKTRERNVLTVVLFNVGHSHSLMYQQSLAIKTCSFCVLPTPSPAPCALASTLTTGLYLLFTKLPRNSSAIRCICVQSSLFRLLCNTILSGPLPHMENPYPECLPQRTWVFLLYH